MAKFALAVTAAELVLTLGAALLVSAGDGSEPYLTPEDLRELRIPFESCKTVHRSIRLNADWSWDTKATLLEPRDSLYTSRMVNASPEEYTRRLDAEQRLWQREGDAVVVRDDPYPGESGFAVRHRGRTGVRAELVRMRGGEILIVRVQRELGAGKDGKADVASCERRAGIIQACLLQRLGWR